MNKWLENKKRQRKLREVQNRFLYLSDVFFKLTLVTEDATKVMNNFTKAYFGK